MKIISLIFSTSLAVSLNAHAGDIEKVIYGVDNRQDVYCSSSTLYKNLARGTAAMISVGSLETNGDYTTIKGGTLENDGICSNERFSKQPTAANCSGFLVGKDLLVTAGHCITSITDCDEYAWVFDYANTTSEQSSFTISNKNIYKCTKIISRTLNDGTDNDYALVKLDRLTDRTPLKYRTSGKISTSAKLVVIGHPSGLPTKISDGAYVRSNKNKYYFQANLDTFGGNSGSAVFDAKTGIVEGILVRGESDYELDPIANCYRPKVCKMDECRGEDSTRITNIEELKRKL
jgi:V8-like Glu-specific endopeptidase